MDALVFVHLWDFYLISNGFHYFEINCFKNKRIFQLYCFCNFLSNCYQAFLLTTPLSFLINYKLFCLISVLSDGILTLLLILFFKTDMEFLMKLIFVVAVV